MAGFDPDAYLAAGAAPAPSQSPAFDPDAYLGAGQKPLPDVGAPAIGDGGQFSPGIAPVNNVANEASKSFSKAVSNVPASAGQFVENAAHAVAHPIDTATDVGHLVAGVAQYAGVPGDQYKPFADAAGRAILNRYGSLEKAKKTFEDDPVGFASDVWGVISGGTSLLRGVGALPRAAQHVAAPTTEALYDSATGHYDTMHGFGVELHPHVMADTATDIVNELKTQGYRDYLAPKTFKAIEELRTPDGPYMTTQEVEGVRRALGKAAGDPAERDAARRAIGAIDNTMSNLQPVDAGINGHFAPHVAEEAQRARGDYAAAAHADTIEHATSMADLQAASTGSGANIDNAMRQRFRAILASPSKRRGFAQPELDQMEALVRGSTAGNAARLVGKLAPTGAVSGAMSAILGEALGHTVGVPVLGMAAKAASDALTRHNAARVAEQVRLRSPEARRIGATAAPAVLPRFARQVAVPASRLNLLGRTSQVEENAPYRAGGGKVDDSDANSIDDEILASANQPFGELSEPEYGPSQRVGNVFRNLLAKAGANPYAANHMVSGVGNVMGMTPFGAPLALADFVDAKKHGNMAEAAAALMGLIPGPLKEAKPAVVKGLRRLLTSDRSMEVGAGLGAAQAASGQPFAKGGKVHRRG